MVYHRILNIVLCAIQQDYAVLFFPFIMHSKFVFYCFYLFIGD